MALTCYVIFTGSSGTISGGLYGARIKVQTLLLVSLRCGEGTVGAVWTLWSMGV